MENIIGVKELRENLDIYINQVKKGKSFLVIRKTKPVFRISSPDEKGAWEPCFRYGHLAD
jgi:antitoxin (DNA-binding transcriptional repressor) of toxin-antitoxin stability system